MSRRLALLLALLASTSLSGCSSGTSSSPPPERAELLLRSYEVPADQQADAVARVVQQLFAHGGEGFGSARSLPGSSIAVLAPEGVQDGVAELLEGLAAGSVDSARTIGMTYWFVRGLPGDRAPRPDELRELQQPLDAIGQAQGATSFELLERLRVSSVTDEEAELRGRLAWVEQRVRATGETVIARVQARLLNNEILATVALPPGRFVVLAEAGIRDTPGEPGEGMLYVILRSSLDG